MAVKIAENVATRPDADILREVALRMKKEEAVPDDRIRASVSDGTLTLEGTVDWNHQRDAAENCAKTVLGVRRIVNKIAIVPEVSPRESW